MPLRCLNCGEPAPLNFCPACGQAVDDRRRPLLGLLADFLADFFALDGRLLRTTLALLDPGRLTQLHLAGKRASILPPVRVYFVASLLFFFLVGFPAPDAGNYNVRVGDVLVGRAAPDPELGNIDLSLRSSSWLGRRLAPLLEAKWEQLRAMPAQDLLDQLFTGLERTVPSALICFVPLLALALKLLYLRRSWYYVDHLVFALHFQSALFLALVIAFLANELGLGRVYPGLLTYLAVFLLVAPVYLLLALKRVYGQSWIRTAVKTGTLAVLYLLLLQPLIGLTFLLVVRGI